MVNGTQAPDGSLREIAMKRHQMVEMAGTAIGAALPQWCIWDSIRATRVKTTVRSGRASNQEGRDVGGCTQPHEVRRTVERLGLVSPGPSPYLGLSFCSSWLSPWAPTCRWPSRVRTYVLALTLPLFARHQRVPQKAFAACALSGTGLALDDSYNLYLPP
jgi:hypothetical protein